MLGNWSFGDYFKKEAIEWAWELVVERWKFPPERLYATVYRPGPNEPSDFDQEAHDHWARLFPAAGLDPAVHIVNGNKKDNFWMMGDTGPCGPCTEIHVDLTPAGDTRGSLVNAGDARCIEIWNLVFIQFNANPDGTLLSPARPSRGYRHGLRARHRDHPGHEESHRFHRHDLELRDRHLSSDLRRDRETERQKIRLAPCRTPARTGQRRTGIKIDIAFRVIADHIRTLSFAIADGIQPSNEGRGYVLRRILRRAVRYGRSLGFHEPFFYKLVDVLARTMGDVFPEIARKPDADQRTCSSARKKRSTRRSIGACEVFEDAVIKKLTYFEELTRHDRMRTV